MTLLSFFRASSTPDERAHLLSTNEMPKNTKPDAFSVRAIHVGVSLFALLVLSVLVRLNFTVFTYHPLFMTIFIVSATEGVALLQSTETQAEKEKGLRYHAVIQGLGYTSAVLGFSAIFYNKVISNKAHFTSAHGQLGATVFAYLFVQSVFGLLIAYAPNFLIGRVSTAKRLWKYHRITGYILLVLVWLTAQLGVRADYIYSNQWSPHLIWLHWLALVLVAGGLASRVRLSKWGIRQRTASL